MVYLVNVLARVGNAQESLEDIFGIDLVTFRHCHLKEDRSVNHLTISICHNYAYHVWHGSS